MFKTQLNCARYVAPSDLKEIQHPVTAFFVKTISKRTSCVHENFTREIERVKFSNFHTVCSKVVSFFMNCILGGGVEGERRRGRNCQWNRKRGSRSRTTRTTQGQEAFPRGQGWKKEGSLAAAKSTSASRFLSRVCFFTDGGIVETFWMEASCYVPPLFLYLEALFRPRREVLRLRA